MDRPRHGFDRTASHCADEYVCDCGARYCSEADKEWMDWAEQRIAELESQLAGCTCPTVAQLRRQGAEQWPGGEL